MNYKISFNVIQVFVFFRTFADNTRAFDFRFLNFPKVPKRTEKKRNLLNNNLKQIYQGAFFAMKSDEGQSVSIWEATGDIGESSGGLVGDLQTDVCIIGAGIAGLTTACLPSFASK